MVHERGGDDFVGGRGVDTCVLEVTTVDNLLDQDTYNLEQVRGIMAQLPNLDDLLLSGAFVPVDRVKLVGIGTVLRGRFGGRLQLLNGYADHDVVNMLLEIPTGLRFTEVGVRGMYGCLPSTVRLAKACCKTLIKLSYKASSQCRPHIPCPALTGSNARGTDVGITPWRRWTWGF